MFDSSRATSSTDLLPTTDPSPSTGISPIPDPRRSGLPIVRRSRRLALSEVMKTRPLQRKAVQKRTPATLGTSSPPRKRAQRQQAAANYPPEARRQSNPVTEDTRQPPFSPLQRAADENVGNGNEQSHPAARNPPNNVNDNRGNNGVRPIGCSEGSPAPRPDELLTRHDLLQIMKASEQRILSHIVSQQRVLLERIESVESVTKDLPTSVLAVNKGIVDVKMMLLPGGNKSNSRRTTNRLRNRTKSMKLQDKVCIANPTLPAELDIIFGTDVACVAAAKGMAAQMEKFHRNRESLSVSSRAINVFLHSSKKVMGKSDVKEGIGFRHCEFRFKVVKILLNLTKTIPDSFFSIDDVNANPEGEREGNPQIEGKPSSLTSGLLDTASLTLARKHHEWFVSDLPKDPTEPSKRKALFISKRYFKAVVDMLRAAREKCRVKMYEDGLYCLLNWEKLTWFSKELNNPILMLVWPNESTVSPTQIPETAIGDFEQTRANNAELLQRLISERKDMLVEARYDVIVSDKTTAQGRKQDEQKEKRPLKRVINILRLAMSFMCGFCHLSEEELLRAHPAMLRCMYRVAMVIRDIFATHMPPSKRYVKPLRTRGRVEGSDALASVGDAATETLSNRRQSETGTNATEDGSSVQPLNQCTNNDHQSSRRRTMSGNTVRSDEFRPEETPPIGIAALFPAESEMDRILNNYTDISTEAYNRINVPSEDLMDVNRVGCLNQVESDLEGDVEDSDSEDDNMLDMLSDED